MTGRSRSPPSASLSPTRSGLPPASTRTRARSTRWPAWASASSRSAPSRRGRSRAIRSPRLFRLAEDAAVINRMGFNNAGLDAIVAAASRRAARRGPVGVNIGMNRDGADPERDYPALDRRGRAATPTTSSINVSSPNTPGLRDLQSEARLRAILRARGRGACHAAPPLLVKLAPDLDDAALATASRPCSRAASTGLIIANTTLDRPAGLRSPARGRGGRAIGRAAVRALDRNARPRPSPGRAAASCWSASAASRPAPRPGQNPRRRHAGPALYRLRRSRPGAAAAPQGRACRRPPRRRLRLHRRGGRHRLMQHLSGFAPLCPRYDGFILDLWGVIHDGVTPIPAPSIASRAWSRRASAWPCSPTRPAGPHRRGRRCARWASPTPIPEPAHLRRSGASGAARPHRSVVRGPRPARLPSRAGARPQRDRRPRPRSRRPRRPRPTLFSTPAPTTSAARRAWRRSSRSCTPAPTRACR